MSFSEMPKQSKRVAVIVTAVAALIIALSLCFVAGVFDPLIPGRNHPPAAQDRAGSHVKAQLVWGEDIPEYSGDGWILINDNVPQFADDEITAIGYERYSPTDFYGRPGVAMACVGPETMPTEKRSSISEIHPPGWQDTQYDFVTGSNLYNRSHLISYALAGEDLNSWNLVTGTQYMNQKTMQIFENMALGYVRETGNHLMYRVSPVYVGQDLVCRGVQMEALSVEDGGEGISFNVFCYNVQPGVVIDYRNGSNRADEAAVSNTAASGSASATDEASDSRAAA